MQGLNNRRVRCDGKADSTGYCSDHKRGWKGKWEYDLGSLKGHYRRVRESEDDPWDLQKEIAALRALLHSVTNRLAAGEIDFFEANDRIEMLTEKIRKVSETHHKIQEGMKVRLDTTELQDVVTSIVAVIRRFVPSARVRRQISAAIQTIMEQYR